MKVNITIIKGYGVENILIECRLPNYGTNWELWENDGSYKGNINSGYV